MVFACSTSSGRQSWQQKRKHRATETESFENKHISDFAFFTTGMRVAYTRRTQMVRRPQTRYRLLRSPPTRLLVLQIQTPVRAPAFSLTLPRIPIIMTTTPYRYEARHTRHKMSRHTNGEDFSVTNVIALASDSVCSSRGEKKLDPTEYQPVPGNLRPSSRGLTKFSSTHFFS